MKKIALFVSVLLLAGSLFAAAPAFEAKPGLSGNATMTFGINLDASATGISNSTASNLTLGLISEATDAKGGKDGEVVYGWIEMKNFKMNIDNGDQSSDASKTASVKIETPEISAKLFLGPVYINILGVDNKMTKAGTIKHAILWNQTFDLNMEAAGEYKGLAIGLTDTSVVDVVVGVNSLNDWTAVAAGATTYTTIVATGTETAATGVSYFDASGAAATLPLTANAVYVKATAGAAANAANTDNIYQFYVGAALKAVPNLTAEVAANFTADTDTTYVVIPNASVSDLGVGVKVAYKIAIAEGISVEPYAGMDLGFGNVQYSILGNDVVISSMGWQLDAGLTLGLPGDKKKIEFAKIPGGSDVGKDNEIEYAPGLTAMVTVNGASSHAVSGSTAIDTTFDGATDLGFYFFDGSIIPVVNLLAVVELTDVGDKVAAIGQTGLGFWANVDLGVVAPYAKVFYTGDIATMEVGVDVTAVTNTTFTLKYVNEGLAKSTADKGTITLATKIAY